MVLRSKPKHVYPGDPKPVSRRASRRRFLPPGGWVHVSSRTQHGRFAFVPKSDLFTALCWGFVGRGMARYGVQVAAFELLSGHFHIMVRAGRPAAISSFIQYLKSNLARLTHEWNGTSGTVWEGPFRSSVLLDDEAEAYWLAYICAHGVKEKIVSDPALWPGANSIRALTDGAPIHAVWFDRPVWHRAGRPADRTPYYDAVEVKLTPLSRWEGAPPKAYRDHCRAMVDDIIEQHAAGPFSGAASAVAMSATFVPGSVKKTRNRPFSAHGLMAGQLIRAAGDARHAAAGASADALADIVRHGYLAWRAQGGEVPHGTDFTAHVNDALDRQPIVGPFRPDDPDPPDQEPPPRE